MNKLLESLFCRAGLCNRHRHVMWPDLLTGTKQVIDSPYGTNWFIYRTNALLEQVTMFNTMR